MKCKYCKKEHENNNIGCENSGDRNSGDRNSGHYNSGHYNSGHYNSGDYNSGDRNSGHLNSGHLNSGDRNSGDRNSGHLNSGDYNSGDRNSGDRNSGHYNSGDYNSGHYNSGWFNTNEPKMRIFNKDTDLTFSEFAKKGIIYPDLKICAWVELKYLPKDEQTESAQQMGGLLKTLSYKEAWKEYWGRASKSDKQWFKNLPNFDAQIFEQITGIKIDGSLIGQEVEVKMPNGKSYKAKITSEE